MEIIQDSVQGGHRILLFSQFTNMLKLIAEGLKENNIDYFYLDGGIKPKDRMDMVEKFNEGNKSVFLISLKAGGSGLNLTGADVVIHYDPWWNPAVENQATDRAYRIGQDKNVQVFKLITKDTIEEKIQKLQQKKQNLVDQVVKPGETFISKMKIEDVTALFNS